MIQTPPPSALMCPVAKFLAAEIGIFEGYVVVYRFIADLHFYCTGGDDENEIILDTVLSAFFEAVAILLRYVTFHLVQLQVFPTAQQFPVI